MTKNTNTLDVNELVNEMEHVLRRGLDKILVDFMDRYNLLEKTHKKIMRLPSIKQEFRNNNDNDSDDDNEFVDYMPKNNDIYLLENRLDKLEKKYDTIVPILDKILNKINKLDTDINELQHIDRSVAIVSSPAKQSSVIETSQNENLMKMILIPH